MKTLSIGLFFLIQSHAYGQGAFPAWTAAQTPGKPTCDEFLALGADPKPLLEDAKRSLFGRPLFDYTQAELHAIRLQTCEDGSRVFYAGRPDYENRRRAGERIQRLQGLLQQHQASLPQTTAPAQPARPMSAPATNAAQGKPDDAEREDLRSGRKKVANLGDAVLLLQPKDLAGIVASPLIRADNAAYHGALTIVEAPNENVLVGQYELSDEQKQAAKLAQTFGAMSKQQYESTYVRPLYALIRINPKTTIFTPDRLRIGARIGVIGTYSANDRSRTNAGVTLTVPVIEASHIGAPR